MKSKSYEKHGREHPNKRTNDSNVSFFRVEKVGYAKDMPRRELFENVISSLNIPGYKFVYLLKGSDKGVELYIGVMDSIQDKGLEYFEVEKHLKSCFKGNFHGSVLSEIDDNNLFKFSSGEEIYGSAIVGIPSVNSKGEDKNLYTQKMNYLSNSMGGSEGEWALMIVCDALSTKNINGILLGIYKKYDVMYKTSQKSKSTNGDGQSSSHQIIDKEKHSYLESIEGDVIQPLRQGLVSGCFKTSIYAMASNDLTHNRLANNFCAIWQGDSSRINPLRPSVLRIDDDEDFKDLILSPVVDDIPDSAAKDEMFVGRQVLSAGKAVLQTCLNSAELSLICSLPSKELPGLLLKESVDFGLNPKVPEGEDKIDIGDVLYQGEATGTSLYLDKNILNSHVFIAGVTGSGKTNTCKKILQKSELPFLIVEPAKTEYRSLVNLVDGLEVYTLGDENVAPFRFNPFELLKGESVTAHVDMLKASFLAAFPMEAAMPYILEEAIYQSYRDFGWNVDGWDPDCEDEANIHPGDPWLSGKCLWPTISTLIKNLSVVVKGKGFGARLESEYIGSLVARLNNLTVGAKGKMLNCLYSTDIEGLLDKKVILELDALKSPEDKCFMMGLIITRVEEAIRLRHSIDSSYRHITLIEEAHRLLEKIGPGDSGNRKYAVNMFADLLAEVRKYGESLVVVDQIPNKLAPEVLKNTNTKIIHKLFARDDREAVGDTISLSKEQKDFLPHLDRGEVVVYSGDWDKAAHAKIDEFKENNISDKDLVKSLKKNGDRQLLEGVKIYYPEWSLPQKRLTQEGVELYKRVYRQFWLHLSVAFSRAKKTDSNSGHISVFNSGLKRQLYDCTYSDEYERFIFQLVLSVSLRLEVSDREYYLKNNASDIRSCLIKFCSDSSFDESESKQSMKIFYDVCKRIFN